MKRLFSSTSVHNYFASDNIYLFCDLIIVINKMRAYITTRRNATLMSILAVVLAISCRGDN
jgi:hypothetical protein